MQLLFLLFSSYFASLFCLYLNTRYADLKVPFDMMGHIYEAHLHLMQPSMGTLNLPSSRVVKNLTPSRRWILRCINLGIGESSPNLFFQHDESLPSKIWSMVNLEWRGILFFCYSVYLKVNFDLEKTNRFGESSPNFIFTPVNLDPLVKENRWTDGESWPNDFVEKVNRVEDVMWVGSRWPLMHA